MIKILFVCHGNICRSPMAQFLFQHIAEEKGYSVASVPGSLPGEYADFYVDSAATSREEIGNPVDRRTVAALKSHGIACGVHYARQITGKDYDFYDYILLMDEENQWGLRRMISEDPDHKIHLILEYAKAPSCHSRDGSPRNVADPWYTHDFERTYKDLFAGCEGLLEYLTGE